jgi:hypothetical protein
VTAWKVGQSGNPAGRPRGDLDIQKLARSHAPAALAALVAALQSPKERVSAASAILDRAFGRPKQTIDTSGDGTLTLHLLAAQAIGRELLEVATANAPTINGDAVETTTTPALDATLPSE